MLGMGAFIGQVYAQSLEEPVLTTSEEALPDVLEAEETKEFVTEYTDGEEKTEDTEENLPEAKRFIGVDCFEVNNIRHFIVSNYIEESVLDRNPQLHTTKEDAENHGLGILSVKKVVNQYGGLIDISEENSRFMVHIACV